MIPLYHWLVSNVWPLLALGVIVGALSYVLGGVVWVIALRHEERKQAEQRKTLDKIMQASHKPPTAAGWPHRRVS